ncbi:MAG: DNA polymerase I [Oscillospiraceae bacterium]|nr:DNA polymerase I [Oscillospiraceae bacterium]
MKLMVLDGNSIVNRAFYGVRLLSTRDGVFTNAVYGFINILRKLISEESPDALCVAFDLKAPTFRHEKYAEYKAQRKGMPDELASQMPILKETLDAMNIRRYELSGFEADDLIGTISRRCEKDGWDCIIVTGDKDSFQLITDKTSVKHVKTRMGQTETKLYTPETFSDEYGFEPIRMIDLKALMGDSSDNIPGVPGIGEKTAMELLHNHGGLDGVYAEIDAPDIKPGARKKLEEGRDSAYMSYDLATIVTDAPIEFKPDENLAQSVDNDRLYEIFRRLEFNKLIEVYGLKAPAAPESEEIFEAGIESRNITDISDAAKTVEALKPRPFVAVSADDDLSAVALVSDDESFIFTENALGTDWDSALRLIFASDIKKAGHNIKDLQRALLSRGIESGGWVFDTALAAYLIDPTASSYDLRRLASEKCAFRFPDFEDDGGQLTFDMERVNSAGVVLDAAAISMLKEELEGEISELGLDELYYETELPLCAVLADMENTGILVDRAALLSFGEVLGRQLDTLEAEIYGMACENFNINSPKQLGSILFEKLMLPAPKKTKTGWSTNIDVLENLKSKHPIIDHIVEYRQLSKLKSTYTDGLQKFIEPDGRIRTNFQMTVTATGRLSSTDPNLQNIPVRTPLGGELRKMFVAGEGNVLVDADYSQIELRLLAHISGDEHMKAAFQNGEDIHRSTAARVAGIPIEDVTPLLRSRAKAVNFGIVYGISAFSLSQDIGVTVAEAKSYIDSYLENFSGVREYMKNIVEKAKRDGFVTTVYGRRRDLPELKSSNFNLRSFGERVALNMPIQGTAADIMKKAMVNVHRRLKAEGVRGRLLLQIHDELIVECPEEEKELISAILKEEMESAASFSVPITADTSFGKSWYEAK